METVEMSGISSEKRIQNYMNRNIFTTSVDSAFNFDRNEADAIVGQIDEPDCAEQLNKDGGITALQAAWNVTNAVQGMFIVGLPVAVKVGGWWTVFALIGVAYMCYSTGLLLIDCLYDNGKKIRYSYREVAESYHPKMGRFVLLAQLTELLSTCIIYIVIAADLLQNCIPSVDKSAWMMLVTTTLLGCSFLDSITVVSHLSLANAISHVLVNTIVIFYCLSQSSNWAWSEVPFTLDIRSMPTVIGVVVFGYTSHIFLPSLEASMKNPCDFKWMLKWSHIIAAAFKAIFGLLGFLTFGELTQNEITNSLPNQTFKVIVNMILVIKALLSYPLPYFAAVRLITENFFRGTPTTTFTSCYGTGNNLREWALCLRIILLLLTLMMALSVPYLIELMGLIGNITGTLLSFIWPALFHLKIKSSSSSKAQREFDYAIVITGTSIMVIGIYFSSMELAAAIRYGEK